MHGLNCLFFREQTIVFVIKNSTVYIACHAQGGREGGGREGGGREGIHNIN